MWFQLKAYFNFLFHSRNQHGVHSPFVYQLITECFYDKKRKTSYKTLKNFRRDLREDKRVIKVNNFEANTNTFPSEEKKITVLAKKSGTSLKRSKLLNRLIPYLKIKNAVEFGTSIGISTASMATDNDISIQTIETSSETAQIAIDYFKKYQLKNITLLQTSFQKAFQEIQYSKIDLVYINDKFSTEAILETFNQLLPYIHNDSVFIFNQIHQSKDKQAAWQEIKTNPNVTVTIDTFYWGFVFFRKEQRKEHFKIRL